MFRFTIRDVLWLTVVVALGVGWGLNRVQMRKQQDALRKQNFVLEAENAALGAVLQAAEAATSP